MDRPVTSSVEADAIGPTTQSRDQADPATPAAVGSTLSRVEGAEKEVSSGDPERQLGHSDENGSRNLSERAAVQKRTPGWRRPLTIAGVSLAGALLIVFGLRWASSPPDLPSPTNIAVEWNAAIAQLGIEPVYPPQEDLDVGDIYLIVTGDRTPDGSVRAALQGRSLKVWHDDLSNELKQALRATPYFADTLPRPTSESDIWVQKANDGPLFEVPPERRVLPLVMFPGIALGRIQQANASTGWTSSLWSAVLGSRSGSERSVELRVPAAETYGVPAVVSQARLLTFCADPNRHFVCTEAGARRLISSVVGSAAFEMIPVKDNPQQQPRLTIEIALVGRVFLTRSISTVVRNDSGFGVQARLVKDLSTSLQRLNTTTLTAGASPSETTEITELRKTLNEERARLQASLADYESGLPGGTASVQSISQSRISLTQTLQRPVVIGFLASRRELFKD